MIRGKRNYFSCIKLLPPSCPTPPLPLNTLSPIPTKCSRHYSSSAVAKETSRSCSCSFSCSCRESKQSSSFLFHRNTLLHPKVGVAEGGERHQEVERALLAAPHGLDSKAKSCEQESAQCSRPSQLR